MDQSIHDRDIFELYDEADEKMLKVNSLISRQSGMSPFITEPTNSKILLLKLSSKILLNFLIYY